MRLSCADVKFILRLGEPLLSELDSYLFSSSIQTYFMRKFKNKIIIITGAASGIGRALANALARRRAHVVACDIDGIGVQRLVDQLSGRGFSAEAHTLDVTDEHAFTTLIQQVAQQHGTLDYIFNNAGIAIAGEVYNMSIDDWRKVIDVNLMGVIYGTNAAYKIMVTQGHGHIVNIASASGLVGLPFSTPYAATKGAVVQLSNSLRMEARLHGVKVSVICPGFISTNIYASALQVGRAIDPADDIPIKLMNVDKAAKQILRGVRRNKAMVVFPKHAKLFWAVERINHGLFEWLGRSIVRQQRAKWGD